MRRDPFFSLFLCSDWILFIYPTGEYPTTLTFSQPGLPTKTDASLNLILPILAAPIVQKIVGGSALGYLLFSSSWDTMSNLFQGWTLSLLSTRSRTHSVSNCTHFFDSFSQSIYRNQTHGRDYGRWPLYVVIIFIARGVPLIPSPILSRRRYLVPFGPHHRMARTTHRSCRHERH